MRGNRTRPVSSWWQRIELRERRLILAIPAAMIVTTLLVAIVAVASPPYRPYPDGPGVIGGSTPVYTTLYSDPNMLAIAAAREDSRFDPIAETPQAKWFSDWTTSTTIRKEIGDYLTAAAAVNAVPTIVLYRIPNLDCGGGSQVYTGAQDEQEYKDWVDAAAAALKGHEDAIVILEPDALPQLGHCEQGDRTNTLRYAVDALSTTRARVYIDAGHENWLGAAEIADRLKKVDVGRVTGFSLNVSNYNKTEGEVTYAESVRSELGKLGVTDVHYVIDISRNGAGWQDDYCNAPGARIGHAPQLYRGGALDGLLWVKNPGESDGICHGGPTLGFWQSGALRLLEGEGAPANGAWSVAEWIAVLAVAVDGVAVAAVLGFLAVKRRRARL
ncbi:glycoside hydrolase family 6 protein [Mycolicibacterium sp. Dal123E01]|uniref:glycoside hydrolase family 6 protein n=1 Tax=Mycolicibacterium sp. Dal123E01 TaxID=3457578 RepID=UPI00403EF43C